MKSSNPIQKKWCLFVLVLVGIGGLFSGTTSIAKTIHFMPYPGDEQAMTISSQRVRFQAKRKVQEMKMRTKVHIRTDSRNDHASTVTWQYEKADIYYIYPENDLITPLLEELNQGIAITLNIDENGNILSFVNLDQVKTEMAESIQKIDTKLRKQNAQPGMRQMLVQKIKAIYLNENNLKKNLLKEPELYYKGYGKDFGDDNKIAYETTLVNPVSGTPIDGRGEYVLSRRDGCDVIDWHQSLDPEKAKAFMQTFVKNMQNAGRSVSDSKLDVIDVATFVLKDQCVISVKSERKAMAADDLRIDQKEFVVNPSAPKQVLRSALE